MAVECQFGIPTRNLSTRNLKQPIGATIELMNFHSVKSMNYLKQTLQVLQVLHDHVNFIALKKQKKTAV